MSLAQRILELQIKELEMDLAEWDYQLAVARNSEESSTVANLEAQRQSCLDQWTESKGNLQALLEEEQAIEEAKGGYSSLVVSILDNVADWTTDYGNNKAPYRGAMGYGEFKYCEEKQRLYVACS